MEMMLTDSVWTHIPTNPCLQPIYFLDPMLVGRLCNK